VRTAHVDGPDGRVAIDMGAQYYNPRVYPTYARLLEHLGVATVAGEGAVFTAPGTVTLTQAGAAQPTLVSPSLPDRTWPLAESWNQAAVGAFAKMAEGARRLERDDVDWAVTVADWLPTLGIDQPLLDGLVLPWIAAINSGSLTRTLDFSARSAIILLSRAVGDGPLESVTYFTLTDGMGAVLQRLVDDCRQVTVRTGAPVRGVERRGARLRVHAEGAAPVFADPVVLALPGPHAVEALGDLVGVEATRAALGGVEIYEAELALHDDAISAPSEARMRSLLNATLSGDHCEVSMSMAEAIAPASDGTRVDLWKSWVTHRAAQPSSVRAREMYTHIHTSPATLDAQARLAALQGEGGLYFAGGWTATFDAQETALVSALDVARRLAPASDRVALLD
jgi:predicted NAD/FAD-binding protein